MLPFPSMILGKAASTTTQDGALAYRTAAVGTGIPAFALQMTDESYDRSGYHDNATNNERLTISSTSLVRVVGTIAVTSGGLDTSIRKGGASFVGSPWRTIAGASGYAGNVKTGPISVSAADYFELWRESSANQTLNANYNYLGIEVLDPSLSYAFVNKTGTQSIASGAAVALTWDNDVANVGGGWHSTVTNNSRLKVPVGVSRVRVTAGNRNNASTTGSFYLTTSKNGVGTYPSHGLASQSYAGSTQKGVTIATAIMAVTGGTDYFELDCVHFHSSATSFGSNYCWASIEDCSSSVACLAKRSSSQAISATTWTSVQWNAEEYKDVAAMHDTSTNPSRLIVPSGYTQARVTFNFEAASNDIAGAVIKNGAGVPGCAMDWNAGLSGGRVNGMSAWMDVTSGDYFEVQVYTDSATNITNSTLNWACLEVR